MERSVLVRRTAPVAVFAAVLAGLIAIAARNGDTDARGSKQLNALPLAAAGGRNAAEGTAGAPRAADSKAMYYGGEIVIPDRLIDGVPTKGPVHNVTGTPSTDRIAALAKALGVTGEVRSDSEGWVVGDGDVVLRVMKYAGLPWFLGGDKVAIARDGGVAGSGTGVATAEPAQTEPKPPAAPSPAPSGDDTPVSSGIEPSCKPTPEGTVCTEPAPADCPPPPDGAEPACVPATPIPEPTKPPQPSDAEARTTAQRVFDALGLSGATITLNDAWSGKEVVASPVVGGLPTVGFETRVTVEIGPKVQYASGFLGGTDFENDYPLLAPRDAVKRGGAWGPRILMDSVGAPCEVGKPCPTPAPREATTLRLGLLFMASYDGTQDAYLAPAWLLTFEGSTFEEPVLALPDQYIATPPPATDQPKTDPGSGTEPGDSGGGSVDGSAGSTGAPNE